MKETIIAVFVILLGGIICAWAVIAWCCREPKKKSRGALQPWIPGAFVVPEDEVLAAMHCDHQFGPCEIQLIADAAIFRAMKCEATTLEDGWEGF